MKIFLHLCFLGDWNSAEISYFSGVVLLVLVFQCIAATFCQAVGTENTQKSLFREDVVGDFCFVLVIWIFLLFACSYCTATGGCLLKEFRMGPSCSLLVRNY